MDIIPFNFIRPMEEIPQRTMANTTLQDIPNTNFLSSPISAYDIKVHPNSDAENLFELHVTHRQPYPLRTQYLKGQIAMLREETRGLRIDYAATRHDHAQLKRDHTQLKRDHAQLKRDHTQLKRDHAQLEHDHALLRGAFYTERQEREHDHALLRGAFYTERQEREAEREKIADWETRSRIARGLNDQWVPFVMDNYNLLKDNGITYLPHILSVWAIKEGHDPAPSFLGKIHQDEVVRMLRRAESFESKGLRDVVELLWDAITTTDRNMMVAMYLGTRSHPRTSIAHPSLTGHEARRVIRGDPSLSIEEKNVAYEIINTAIDENGDLLFSNF